MNASDAREHASQSEDYHGPHLGLSTRTMSAQNDDRKFLDVAILAFAIGGIYASYLTQVIQPSAMTH